jgi:predicted transcriptional regulator
MKRDTPLPGGELEYAVLIGVWELGTASTPDIHRRVGGPAGLAYTTTAKVLDRLYAKGLVSRVRKGKLFIYRPKVSRDVVESARARQVLSRLLGPSPRPAMAALVEAVESLDPALLDELERLVTARRRSQHGS